MSTTIHTTSIKINFSTCNVFDSLPLQLCLQNGTVSTQNSVNCILVNQERLQTRLLSFTVKIQGSLLLEAGSCPYKNPLALASLGS